MYLAMKKSKVELKTINYLLKNKLSKESATNYLLLIPKISILLNLDLKLKLYIVDIVMEF
jgi:hypothetical protein